MMKRIYYLSMSLIFAFSFTSCLTDDVEITEQHYYPEELQLLQQNLNLPAEPLDYTIELPEHIRRSGLFARNINKDRATLGRVLFYDKALSIDGEIACASCHKQELAFSDDKALSDGVESNLTGRNSLALGSVVSFAAYYGQSFGSFGVPFLWDNRAGTAAEQARLAFTSEKEMGLTMDEVTALVDARDFYDPLFRRAYGKEPDGSVKITEERILGAIAEFVDGLGSFSSKYDEAASAALEGTFGGQNVEEWFDGLTDAENRGKTLFLNGCASCHSPSVAGRPGKTSANNGLDMVYDDLGVGGATNFAADNYKFKVPTLRNIAVTGPYMHDGRFETLEEVIDFYSNNIHDHPQLDEDLREYNGDVKQFNYTDQEKEDLISFLNSLTDESYLDPTLTVKYSDPFK